MQQTKAAAAPGAVRLDGLDGLRGLAMLMVIACHLQLVTAAWTGLSSFFVLSGFLITRILLSDRAQGDGLGPFFRRFYMRRLLRVFPIYYAYLVVLTIGVAFLPNLGTVRGDLPSAYLYYLNLHRLDAGHVHTRMLDHLWSLSVEEQFYLVWPWLIAFVPRRWLPRVCIGLFLLGPALRQWAMQAWLPTLNLRPELLPNYLYIVTTSHIDAFALGALINFVDWRPSVRVVLASVAALLAIGFAVNGWFGMHTLSLGWPLFLPHGAQYLWGYSLIDFYWFMVILAILEPGPVKRFFSMRVFDYLGKRSYSTYIVHFPILAAMLPLWDAARGHLGTAGTLLFAVPYLAVVFTTSGLTYRFIEKPMSELKDRFRASRKPGATAAAPAPKTVISDA
jgi:peptidoglycan/LPS O-acetylase OafA/YrhL